MRVLENVQPQKKVFYYFEELAGNPTVPIIQKPSVTIA